jgi:hypothetical protein
MRNKALVWTLSVLTAMILLSVTTPVWAAVKSRSMENVTAAAGDRVDLNAVYTTENGNGLTYRWFKNGSLLKQCSISVKRGADVSLSYPIGAAAASDAGSYWLNVASGQDGTLRYSTVAVYTLTVKADAIQTPRPSRTAVPTRRPASTPTAAPSRVPAPGIAPPKTPTPTPLRVAAPIKTSTPTPTRTPPAASVNTPTPAPTQTTVQNPTGGSVTAVVNFSGVKGVYIDYWSPSWPTTAWVTGTVAYDGSASILIQDNYRAERVNYIIRVRKGGMSYIFPERALSDSQANTFNVPVKAISVTGVNGTCQIAVLQAGWNYLADWIYPYDTYQAGQKPVFYVFDNNGSYGVYVTTASSNKCIDNLYAGAVVDVADCFR